MSDMITTKRKIPIHDPLWDAPLCQRAEAGATKLDGVVLSWWEKINLDSLDMEDAEVCILGQVFESYDDGLEALEIEWPEDRKFGFDLPGDLRGGGRWQELRTCWVDIIERRRKSP